MKRFILLLATIGFVAAGRPEAENVITTFKQLLPLYNSSLDGVQTVISSVKGNISYELAEIYRSIIGTKEEFVRVVIEREDTIQQVIGAQRSADALCLSFVNASSEMNVNLAGVSFTNCVNLADQAIGANVGMYYMYLLDKEQQVSYIRLLDVFQGHNVFHSPQPIIEKLNAKMELLRDANDTIGVIEHLTDQVHGDMRYIHQTYNECMAAAFQLFQQGVNMCQMQMQMICGADLSVASNRTMA